MPHKATHDKLLLGDTHGGYEFFGFSFVLSRYTCSCSNVIPFMSFEIFCLISLKVLTVSNSFTILFFVFIIHIFMQLPLLCIFLLSNKFFTVCKTLTFFKFFKLLFCCCKIVGCNCILRRLSYCF